MYRKYLKRIFDVAVVVVTAPFVLPLVLLIAALIVIQMGRPVLFRQRRPGLYGRSFTILKFRTMRVAPDGDCSTGYHRLTPLGVVLRNTSLDELPQLWNVLRGEMSLIGPRPLLEEYLPYYTAVESRRHLVRPGITGWAQVHGRAILAVEPRLAMDVWYVDHLSWSVDLNIFLRTVWRVLARKDVHTPPVDMGRSLFWQRQANCGSFGRNPDRSFRKRHRTGGWIVDRAGPGDGAAVANLLSRVLSPRLNELSIWSSPKLSNYLEDVLCGNAPAERKELYVLRQDAEIGGALCLRQLDGEIWIDNINVKEELRSAMLGNLLLARALDAAGEAGGATSVGWHAVLGNPRQDHWHERMGGVEQSRNSWWLASPEVSTGCPGLMGVAYALPAADRQHKKWGFSEFELETAAGRYKIGRLSGPYFRLVLPAPPSDPDLLVTLRSLDPTRRLFLFGPELGVCAGWEKVGESRCLRADRVKMVNNLSAMARFSKSWQSSLEYSTGDVHDSKRSLYHDGRRMG